FIYLKFSIVIVFFIPIFTILINYFLQEHYVNKYYHIESKDVHPNFEALSEKNSALIHSISYVVLNNTDILLLTIRSGNPIIISIYNIYEMIFNQLTQILNMIFLKSS